MPSLQTLLVFSLASIALCACGCVALIVMLYRHYLAKERSRLKEARLGIADMAILFQTMRDIIAQQKNLAREFNQEVDRKTGLVKTILARGLEKNEKLYEQQQALVRQIEEARAQLDSIQRQIGYLKEPPKTVREAVPDAFLDETTEPEPSAPAKQAAPEAARTAAPAATAPAEAEIEETAFPVEENEPSRANLLSAAFAEWAETEGETTFRPQPTPATAPVPEAPEDREAARQAFRALLDMETPSGRTPAHAATVTAGGNGRKNMGPLQRRVLEYSEAGMTVAQISRELGVGKGEVRLMLSLLQHRKA